MLSVPALQTRQELALAKEDAAVKSTVAADAIRRHTAWKAMFEHVTLTVDSLCRMINDNAAAFQRSALSEPYKEIAVCRPFFAHMRVTKNSCSW
jgi:hypothetical protein